MNTFKTLLAATFMLCLLVPSYGQLKVVADGKVGIATTAPTQALDVNGQLRVQGPFILHGKNAGTGEAGILVGAGRVGTGSSTIRFYPTWTDFNNWGTTFGIDPSGSGGLFHQGAGTLGMLTLNSQNLQMGTANTYKMTILGSNGFVGVNTSVPAFQFEVNGNAAKPGGGDWTAASDKRLKKDIRPFEDGLEEVMKLNPVVFKYNGEGGIQADGKEFVGVIAQEIQKVAPYTVSTFTHKKTVLENVEGAFAPVEKVVGEEEFLSVDASAIRYMLVNAVQEQQKMIEEKDAEIKALEQRLDRLERLVETLGSNPASLQAVDLGSGTRGGLLKQNQPNPFSTKTTIGYTLPEGTRSASLKIQDASGAVLRDVQLATDTRSGEVVVNAGELAPGAYSYTLFIDGKVFDAKKMILTN